MKSPRNKTIDFPIEQAEKYLSLCVNEKSYDGSVNQIVTGDAFSGLKKIADKSVDLLIVDPPYNLAKNFHGLNFKAQSQDEYAKYTLKWLDACLPKLKDNASVYVCCDWKSSLVIGGILSSRLILRNRITWQREKGRGAKSNWKNSMEDVFFATVSDDYKFNLDAVKVRRRVLAPYNADGKPKDWESTTEGKFRNTCPSNFWDDISVPYWSMAENTAHPTQKPEKLIAKLILASSNEGDVVLDPFAGSGTTAVVAEKLNRKFICLERNPLYCAWAQKRLENAKEDSSIQGYEGGVFWEKNTTAEQRQHHEKRSKRHKKA
ncbi:MAG: site-specific DNA-methyltransferase [Clostridiales bacterium]|nr:site-specific DNA-methyltransferase [Clostridiales bacterium]